MIKCITICQPFAAAIFMDQILKRERPEMDLAGILPKCVENRSWPCRHRGELLIHAGKSKGWLCAFDDPALRELLGPLRGVALDYGAIIGRVNMTDSLHIDVYRHRFPGDRWAFGPFCHVYPREGHELFQTAVPYAGRQGMFEVPEEAL